MKVMASCVAIAIVPSFVSDSLKKDILIAPQQDILIVDYSWHGVGNLEITYCGKDNSTVRVMSSGEVVNSSFMQFGSCFNTPIVGHGVNGLNGISIMVNDKEYKLSNGPSYKPSENMHFVIDLAI